MSRVRKRLVAQIGAELGALIAGARVVTNRAAAAFVAGLPGLQPAAFHVARALRVGGVMRPSDLAVGLDMDKGALSRLLSDLEAARLVAKRPHPDDGRALAVALTRTGEARLARALAGKGAALTERLARFEEQELVVLAGLLGRLSEP